MLVLDNIKLVLLTSLILAMTSMSVQRKRKRSACRCRRYFPVIYGFSTWTLGDRYRGKNPVACKKCKEPGMTNVTVMCCIECGEKQPSRSREIDGPKLYCWPCAKQQPFDTYSKDRQTCMFCKKAPLFGPPNETKRTCVEHRRPIDTAFTSAICCRCQKKQSSFKLKGGRICKSCILPDEKNIESRQTKCLRCKEKSPSFGIPGTNMILFCAKCVTREEREEKKYVDIKHRNNMCSVEGCWKRRYNRETYCATCAQVSADVQPTKKRRKQKTCITCKEKQPSFGHEGSSTALYCAGCIPQEKKGQYVNVKHRKDTCKANGCKKRRYNGENYCATCAQVVPASESPALATLAPFTVAQETYAQLYTQAQVAQESVAQESVAPKPMLSYRL